MEPYVSVKSSAFYILFAKGQINAFFSAIG